MIKFRYIFVIIVLALVSIPAYRIWKSMSFTPQEGYTLSLEGLSKETLKMIPAGSFPKQLIIGDGVEVKSSSVNPNSLDEESILIYSTASSAESLLEMYKKYAEETYWDVVSEGETRVGSKIELETVTRNRRALISLSESLGETVVTINYYAKGNR